MPIAVVATGTRSNVTPVVLREDTRPFAYGDKYSEGASRTFYSRYTEYKKRVAPVSYTHLTLPTICSV